MRIRTTQQFILEAKKIHEDKYDYSNVEYINAKTKVIIVCKEHSDFLQIPRKHLQGAGCRKCAYENKKYTNEEIILEAKKIHGDKYDYSKVKYTGATSKIIINCKRHGDFIQQANLHITGSGCVKCFRDNNSLLQRSNNEEFIKKAKQKHGDKYDYSKVKYTNCVERVIIICKVHGEFLQTPVKHLSGGCKLCGILTQTNKRSSNTERFIEKAKVIYGDKYDYSKVEYINTIKKVVIICKEHGEFSQAAGSHLQGHECKICSTKINANKQRMNNEEFIEKAKEKHGDKYDYLKVEYTNCDEKLIIICKEHGEFLQRAGDHLKGRGCKLCAILLNSNKQRSNKEEFIAKAMKKHGDKYDYSDVEYIHDRTKVNIKCKIHGFFTQTVRDHLCGYGCSKCGKVYRKNTNEFIEDVKKIHGDKYDYSKTIFKRAKDKIIITCKIHGDFEQEAYSHSIGTGCPKCSIHKKYSNLQIVWLEFLSKLRNIQIQHAEKIGEFSIPSTRYKADGYCHSTNTIYEFHGTIYHGDPRCCNPNEYNYLGKNYGELYNKTILRENEIRELGYNLVVMWEYDWNKINNSIRNLQQKFRSVH
jgi:uncharacterized C2H2 Zn-finger protein